MSKKKNQIKLTEKIMSQVTTGEIAMKPKWYFVAGSLSFFTGLVFLSVGAIFLVNLTVFVLRRHGPMASWRLQLMFENFPWWIPILAIIGIILGIGLLRKYDFSYKKNFKLIIVSFILAILCAGFLIDKFGFNDYWSRRGRMRQIYHRLELVDDFRRPHRGFNYN